MLIGSSLVSLYCSDSTKALKTISVSEENIEHWRPKFSSLDEFVKAIQPPQSTLLKSSKTPTHYIAIFQLSDNSILFLNYGILKEYGNGSFVVNAQDKEKDMRFKPKWTYIRAVEFVVKQTQTHGIPLIYNITTWQSRNYNIFGYCLSNDSETPKSLIYKLSAWNQGDGLPRDTYSIPFEWNPPKP